MVYWLNYSVIYLIPLIVLSFCSIAFKLAMRGGGPKIAEK